VAAIRKYGGYIGFVSNFFFRTVLGIGLIGSAGVYIALFLIGLLLTFEISLRDIAEFFTPDLSKLEKRAKKEQEEKEEEDSLSDIKISVASDRIIKSLYGEGRKRKNEDKKAKEQEPPPIKEEKKEHEPVKIVKDPINNKEEDSDDKSEEDDKSPKRDFKDWEFPSLDLLSDGVSTIESNEEVLKKNAERIREKLDQFGITVTMNDIHVGPTVIQYTLRPHEGVKLSKITGLKNDLALALAAPAIRIEAPIPGKALVGIEVPNERRSTVHLREIIETPNFKKGSSKLKLPLGRDVSGMPIIADLQGMPHLLIAGATGSGKSVAMNTFLVSLLYQNSPADLKLILIDPKRVELKDYNNIPHLLTPVVTDPEKAAIALRWCVAEMNQRYQKCAEKSKRNITDYNADKAIEEKMSTIVVVIDELADLMMAAGKEVEASICRIAQMARAVGIHLVVATQRPSVDVITGLIKANIPARISFAVSSSIDSRTILDGIGAEDLLGKGDMLFLPGGRSKPTRIQGIYTSSKEIERVTNHIKISMEPDYNEAIVSPKVAAQKLVGLPQSKVPEASEGADDDLYDTAVNLIRENRKASASLLQRRLKVGYARAARLLDEMEEKGVVGPSNGAKPRELFID